jgi:flagellar P-ring protein precursor FlgI
MRCGIIVLAVVLALTGNLHGERIKDIVDIQGIRSNPIRGLGLVIGLNGTGDDSEMSKRIMANVVRRTEDLSIDADDISAMNVAVVMVQANLGPFARRGSRIDVTVSAVEARSLQGAILLETPLKGFDNQVYAVAGGPLIVGGFGASGENSSVAKNHLTVGRIPDGAIVEKEEIADYVQNNELTLLLRNPDFATAENISAAINKLSRIGSYAYDPGTVRVPLAAKASRATLGAFIASIDALQVEVDTPAVVVINERTGTIVIGERVGISTVAIAHGNLSITTEEKNYASQPQPFSNTGETMELQRTELNVAEEGGMIRVIPQQATVSDLARALNALGVTPRDIITIFQQIHAANALQAELKVI